MHTPVLLSEAIDMMDIKPSGTYIDATFGRGGHTESILRHLNADGRIVAFDRDPEAQRCASQLAAREPRLSVQPEAFSKISRLSEHLSGTVDGILFDLGLSSPQLDDPARGFSFREDGPLDMRMSSGVGVSAAEWLAGASESEISDVLWRYGEERRSRQIARRIVNTRADEPLKTTFALADLVRSCVYRGRGRIDPATRTFQAIRIHINDELGEVERALAACLPLLRLRGRVVVIAFHSLEDRIVKHTFRRLDREHREARRDGLEPTPGFVVLHRKPIRPREEEAANNPRARSARLRTLERAA